MQNVTRPRPRVGQRVLSVSQAASRGRANVGNLPRELTSFVGREEQLAEVSRALQTAGLVTLVGIGGVGKTRLALHTATAIRTRYAQGAWLVELAPVTDPGHIAATVADALGLRERPGWDEVDALPGILQRRQLLLVLDNCEHVLQGCAELVTQLLQTCDSLSVLATSREPLGVPGEVVCSVPPLPIAARDEPVERLVECDAVQLLAARIQAVTPTFQLNAANVSLAARICSLVDGLPLGIELAASHARSMSLAEIADLLAYPLRLLTVGPRSAPRRQQALRNTIDWSYALLTEPERALLRRLSVFTGGCTFEAVKAVCGAAEGDTYELIGLLERLVLHSLLIADTRGERTRFGMLETVRHFCLERLEEAGETLQLRARHLDWCVALVAGPPPEAFDTGHVTRLLPDLENLRAALRWAIDTQRVEAATRLGFGMTAVWHLRGSFSEGRTALAAVLDLAHCAGAPAEIAYVGAWAGTMAANQGDYDQAENLMTRSLHVAQELAHEPAALFAENQLGWVAFLRGDVERACTAYERTFQLTSPTSEIHLVARYQLALTCIESGDRDRAVRLLDDFTDALDPAQQVFWVGRLRMAQALLAEHMGDCVLADRLLEQTVVAVRAADDQPGLLHSLTSRGAVALARGDRAAATGALDEALEIAALYGSKLRLTHLLEVLGNLMLETNPVASVRLAAAAERLRSTLGAAPLPSERARVGRYLETAKRRVGEEAYAELWRTAQTVSLDSTLIQAREYLQSVSERGRGASARRDRGEALSDRELEVAMLVTRGFNNREIAAELVISLKTVEAHIHHVLNKLGLSNRVQIATWGLRHERPLLEDRIAG
jgi:non-specific serine/threonine protein kinase